MNDNGHDQEGAPIANGAAVAICDAIRAILDAGPVGIVELQRIENIARTGRELVVAVDPVMGAFLPPKRRRIGGYGMTDAESGDETGLMVAGGIAGPETFAAKSIREIVEVGLRLADTVKNSPEKIVAGIAAARDHGLKDVEATLLSALPLPAPMRLEAAGASPLMVKE